MVLLNLHEYVVVEPCGQSGMIASFLGKVILFVLFSLVFAGLLWYQL
jgi:hypothetical protein